MTSFEFNAESDALFEAILSLGSKKECENFFRDLCTLSELSAMTERFAIVRALTEKKPYRQIAAELGASTATITRVAYWLENGMGGYRKTLARLHHHP